METGVEVKAKAVNLTQTVKAMNAWEESVHKRVVEVLLLPGYGL